MHRRSIRLYGFDYRLPGPYFITLVVQNRHPRFGEIRQGRVILSDAGRIVRDRWEAIRSIDPDIWLDESIVMPDHFHAIVGLSGRTPVGAHPCAPLLARPARSLGALIAQFKATTTRLINPPIDGVRPRLWQRNYFERIIRDRAALERFRRYIVTNPARR